METPRGGGIHFLTHTKKETGQSEISLSCNSPAALDAPFVRFTPAQLKVYRHPGGAGVPSFDRDPDGGGEYQKYTFFTGTFPEKYCGRAVPEVSPAHAHRSD